MAKLAPPLRNLFKELDSRWPGRDHRTDGWYADPRDRISYGHNPDRNGWVHAIDVDKDGINPSWIINNIHRGDRVLWYIIWNRRLWSMDYGWKPYAYHGPSPHTDHMHIEIRHTAHARAWRGDWGIGKGTQSFGSAPDTDNDWGKANFRPEIIATANLVKDAGAKADGYASMIKGLRR